jgi:uncharacterized protein (TIGR00156 family)
MKKRVISLLVISVILAGVVMVYAHHHERGGFTGPGAAYAKAVQAPLVTVEAAKGLPDDTKVTLRGNITRALGGKKYMFRDATGEIVVEIGNKTWRGMSVGEQDLVEIFGEVDVERHGTEIEVKSIRKI